MARIVIALHAAPAASVPAQSRSLLAYHYAQAALVSGHHIDMVFFYSAAVMHAQQPAETETVALWQALAHEHNIPLVICNTVAETTYNMNVDELVAPFQNGGLSEFSMAAAATDHVIQF
ncbi:DsrE family protein [Pseudidiomarina gelatinasegens]|uniref:DsrE family protein n=1 Tax=Pseudidiomarina gelatinasegens TaxID=2487740 RepID=UPI0013E2D4FE|nr:DsrE family protein [Pseudidiomarina gelatinasegens]